MSAEEATLTATTTTTAQQQQSDDLPRAHIKRIMKHQLSKFSHVDPKNNQPFEPNIAKDALDGVQQACKIFIHYLTSTANDICTESKRSTLSAVSGGCYRQNRLSLSLLSLSLSLSLSPFLKNPTPRRRRELFKNRRQSEVAESETLTSIVRAPSLSLTKTKQDDVIRAMREIDFHELEPQLKEHLNQAKTAALQRQALAAASQAEAARKKQKTTGNRDDEDEDEEEDEEEENEGGEGKGKGEEEEEEDGDDEF